MSATILLRWASTLGFPIIHFLEQKKMAGKPTNMSCGILKPVMTSLFQEIASRILQMYETVAPYTLPLQRFLAGCFSPETNACCPFSKPLSPEPLQALLHKTHTGCRYPEIHTGCSCPKPLQKYIPFSVNRALSSASHFRPNVQDRSTPLSRTWCLCRENKKLKFCKHEM